MRTALSIALTILTFGLCSGCQLAGIALDTYQETGTKEVKAEYRGLEGKTFAVVVTADRFIQSEQPQLIDYVTTNLTRRLAARTNDPTPAGFIPAEKVLQHLYDNPGWTSKSMVDLAKGLGDVQRLVFVEITDYQLREPGNQYEWDGVAAGTLSIVELDSKTPDEFAFQKPITVHFPGKKGYGPAQMTQNTVTTALAMRFIDRAAWLMYDHDEKYRPEY
jgi:hypothetical protein